MPEKTRATHHIGYPGGAEILKPDKSAEEAHRHHDLGAWIKGQHGRIVDRDNCHNWLAAAHIFFRNVHPENWGKMPPLLTSQIFFKGVESTNQIVIPDGGFSFCFSWLLLRC